MKRNNKSNVLVYFVSDKESGSVAMLSAGPDDAV